MNAHSWHMTKHAQQNYRTPQPQPTKLPEGSKKQGGDANIKHHEADAPQNDVRENNAPNAGESRPTTPDIAGPM